MFAKKLSTKWYTVVAIKIKISHTAIKGYWKKYIKMYIKYCKVIDKYEISSKT